MITFEPTEEQQMMRDTVADFAKTKLRERTRQIEAARALPDDLRAQVAELGLGALAIPEAYGGSGMGARTAVLVEEELAFGDAGVPFAMPGPAALAHALIELGDEKQCERWFARFASDPSLFGAVAFSEARANKKRPGFNTIAKREGDEWVIDGTKSYVANAGIASAYVVFAQIEEEKGWEGIGAFVVDANAKGIDASTRYPTVGLDAARFGEVKLTGVRVKDEDRLLGKAGDFARGARRFFARLSLHVAARAVGLSRASWQVARDYADERKAFGKPIGHFQSIAFMLADRLMDVDGARGLVWRAAYVLDTKPNDDAELLARCSEAIAEAVEVAQRCGDDGVQILGGAGFVRDYIVEKYMRDAKQIALCAPTAATSDQLFAALSLGAPLDSGLVLPTPEVQPIFT